MRPRDVRLIALVLASVALVAGIRARRAEPLTTGPSVPRLVDLGAGRCTPCRRMAPILAELQAEYAGRADVVFVDVWEQPDLADGYSFRSIPTQIFYDGAGREVWRHEGFLDKAAIMAQFRRLGVQ